MSHGKVLVIDDEEDMLENCSRLLTRFGYEALTCADGRRAADLVQGERPDVVLTDLKMPRIDGLEVLRAVRETDPQVVVVMITGYATVENAVAAIKAGAFDYIPKPFAADQLSLVVQRAVRHKHLTDENTHLKSQLRGQFSQGAMIGVSPAMTRVFRRLEKAAPTDANVLVLGESGTGKELVARALHANSRRYARPFVVVDCAALPTNLLESELFGHEKGAFTSANASKAGLVEMANGGTLFLDEIGELGLDLQAKLLRTLQERQIRKVGGTRLITVDVRVISATNRNLDQMVENGTFRQDLYYRLNVIRMTLPPLRERLEDIPVLVQHFIKVVAERQKRSVPHLAPATLRLLEAYPWPGNVRELQNVVEQVVSLLDGDVIRAADLPEGLLGGAASPDTCVQPAVPFPEAPGRPYREARQAWLDTFEREYLAGLLARHGGNVSHAAEEAGVDRKTIHRMLHRHHLKARAGFGE